MCNREISSRRIDWFFPRSSTTIRGRSPGGGGRTNPPPLHGRRWRNTEYGRGLIHQKYFQTTNAVDTLPLTAVANQAVGTIECANVVTTMHIIYIIYVIQLLREQPQGAKLLPESLALWYCSQICEWLRVRLEIRELWNSIFNIMTYEIDENNVFDYIVFPGVHSSHIAKTIPKLPS